MYSDTSLITFSIVGFGKNRASGILNGYQQILLNIFSFGLRFGMVQQNLEQFLRSVCLIPGFFQTHFVTLNIFGSYLLVCLDYNFWPFPRSHCARAATICHWSLVTSRHTRVQSESPGENCPARPWG